MRIKIIRDNEGSLVADVDLTYGLRNAIIDCIGQLKNNTFYLALGSKDLYFVGLTDEGRQNKIEAIKELRARAGITLNESKDAVEHNHTVMIAQNVSDIPKSKYLRFEAKKTAKK